MVSIQCTNLRHGAHGVHAGHRDIIKHPLLYFNKEYKMFNEYKDIVTVIEAAEMLRVKPYRIYEYLKSGKLKRLNTGKPFVIPKTEVIRFAEHLLVE